jgi:hypothetical protein
MKTVRRGYVPEDEKQFNDENVRQLQRAQQDLIYLLNHHYPMSQSVTFIGNHFQLSHRQRSALMRASCSDANDWCRKARMLTDNLSGRTLYIDGFNVLITLETALSGTTLLDCMDGTIRDLCGLHGTYRLIDKTETAIDALGRQLQTLDVSSAVFVLDAQISNSGRLKKLITDRLAGLIPFQVVLTPHADTLLIRQDCVATSDSGILDQCSSWVNLVRSIIKTNLPEIRLIDLSGGTPGRP